MQKWINYKRAGLQAELRSDKFPSLILGSSVVDLCDRAQKWFDGSLFKSVIDLPHAAMEQLLEAGWLAEEPDPAIRILRGDVPSWHLSKSSA
ncbi:MAG: hypothetical protein ACRYFE_05425 [Janthinobacterium lividum]